MTAGAIFTRDGDAFVPSGHARGPWDPDAQHGGAPGALLASAVQALAPEMQLARLTVDFLGPVPLAPCRVRARITKPGRRFQLAAAELEVEGRVVLRAGATLLRRASVALPEAARAVARTWAAPEDVPRAAAWGTEVDAGFHRTGMDIRPVVGSAGEEGAAAAWFRLTGPLVAGEPTVPVARAVAAGDFGNGVARVLPFETHLFVNTDLSVHLLRDPVGPWVLIDAVTVVDEDGVGQAASVLHDERGPIGHAHQSLFVAAREG